MKVEWNYPQPRQGLAGEWDRFVGPGATPAELILELGFAALFGIGLLVYAAVNQLGWSVLQYAVAAVVAFDIAGGVVTNATTSAKRWYHRPEQGFRQHMTFILVHALQLFLVAWAFQGMDWIYFIIVYGYLLVASLMILKSPLYLQRPVAMIFMCGALLMNSYIFLPAPGMEWFLPFFFLKLLVSHLLREAPYSP